ASAQYGQSKAQKSMTTTFPFSDASVNGAVLIQTSDFLISGAFCPTKASSGCWAYAMPVNNKTANVNLASMRSPYGTGFWSLIRHYSGTVDTTAAMQVLKHAHGLAKPNHPHIAYVSWSRSRAPVV